jgi:DNA-binding NarL/FixJ family response regulator
VLAGRSFGVSLIPTGSLLHLGEENPKKPTTVLIVDDNPQIRAGLRQLFLSDGFSTCIEAENGKEAIETAVSCHPDMIVLDLKMPVMSGLVAAPKLRAVLPNAPIILFSLYCDQFRGRDLSRFGLSAVVSKNEPIERLLAKAHELMGSDGAIPESLTP